MSRGFCSAAFAPRRSLVDFREVQPERFRGRHGRSRAPHRPGVPDQRRQRAGVRNNLEAYPARRWNRRGASPTRPLDSRSLGCLSRESPNNDFVIAPQVVAPGQIPRADFVFFSAERQADGKYYSLAPGRRGSLQLGFRSAVQPLHASPTAFTPRSLLSVSVQEDMSR